MLCCRCRWDQCADRCVAKGPAPKQHGSLPLQALRTCFVKTEEGVVQRVVPLDASSEVLHIRSITSDAGKLLSFSAGRYQLAEGAHGSHCRAQAPLVSELLSTCIGASCNHCMRCAPRILCRFAVAQAAVDVHAQALRPLV